MMDQQMTPVSRSLTVAGRLAAAGAARTMRALGLAFAALTTGARTIPMGDNGPLIRDLARRAARGTVERSV